MHPYCCRGTFWRLSPLLEIHNSSGLSCKMGKVVTVLRFGGGRPSKPHSEHLTLCGLRVSMLCGTPCHLCGTTMMCKSARHLVCGKLQIRVGARERVFLLWLGLLGVGPNVWLLVQTVISRERFLQLRNMFLEENVVVSRRRPMCV